MKASKAAKIAKYSQYKDIFDLIKENAELGLHANNILHKHHYPIFKSSGGKSFVVI